MGRNSNPETKRAETDGEVSPNKDLADVSPEDFLNGKDSPVNAYRQQKSLQ